MRFGIVDDATSGSGELVNGDFEGGFDGSARGEEGFADLAEDVTYGWMLVWFGKWGCRGWYRRSPFCVLTVVKCLLLSRR